MENLHPPVSNGSLAPELVYDGNKLVLSWLEPKGKLFQFKWSAFANNKWDKPQTIVESTSVFANPADRPSIIFQSENTAYAHWLRRVKKDGLVYDVVISGSKDAGATWREIGTTRKNRDPKNKG